MHRLCREYGLCCAVLSPLGVGGVGWVGKVVLVVWVLASTLLGPEDSGSHAVLSLVAGHGSLLLGGGWWWWLGVVGCVVCWYSFGVLPAGGV